MNKLALLTCLALVSLPAMAERMPCEDLRAQIGEKLQTKGVQSYTLEIVPADSAANTGTASGVAAGKTSGGKVVGSCDGGTKKIIYKRE